LSGPAIVVIDVGKTSAKVVLCDTDGVEGLRKERPNRFVTSDGLRVLDAAGIEDWLAGVLRELAREADIRLLVPVAHGAAAAIVRDGRLARPPLDYEQRLPMAMRAEYDRQRDSFAATGSPALPDGLNLGAQLHLLEAEEPSLLSGDAQILLWPQYWSWRLTGIAAAELSSLGCHTDLWRPWEGAPSALAVRRGWAARLPPVRPAGAVLGPLRPEWVERTGLSLDVQVLCGVHDSNAALIAARAFPELDRREATTLSTGTWFVAMRSPPPGVAVAVPEGRDCLVNVDVEGLPVPSARFMGGREIELLLREDDIQIDSLEAGAELTAALASVAAADIAIAPSMVPGTGPFPERNGGWLLRPATILERAAAAALYAALMADAALDLIGARERLLVEGRFARAEAFVRALATLRPGTSLFVAKGQTDLAFGACRLANPALRPPCDLARVEPLDIDLAAHRERWRRHVKAGEISA
jgi:sugar (pentulose or hexulose) kinase